MTQVAESKLVVDVQEAKDYLGIDYADEMIERRLNSVIKSTDLFLDGAIGKGYDRTDSRVKEVALMIIGEMFEDRALTSKEAWSYRRLTQNLIYQLRIEHDSKPKGE